jgi:hypothetical protein
MDAKPMNRPRACRVEILPPYSGETALTMSIGTKQLLMLSGRISARHGHPDADIKARTIRMHDRNSQSKDVLSFGPFSLFVAERLLEKADEATARRPCTRHPDRTRGAGRGSRHPQGANLNGVVGCNHGERQSPLSHRCPSEGAWRRTRRRSLHIQYCRPGLLFCCANHTLE